MLEYQTVPAVVATVDGSLIQLRCIKPRDHLAIEWLARFLLVASFKPLKKH